MKLEGDLGHAGDKLADRPAVRSDGQIFVGKDFFQFHSVHDGKRPFKQRLRDLKSDEVVVLVRCIAILGDLESVESEFGFQMRGLVLRVVH